MSNKTTTYKLKSSQHKKNLINLTETGGYIIGAKINTTGIFNMQY